MKKWILPTAILLSSVCLPLSLIGTETLNWGIIGIGGDGSFNEKGRPLFNEKECPLKGQTAAATQRRAAEKVNISTQVIEKGTIQPFVDSGAYFELKRDVVVTPGGAVDLPVIVLPSSGSPALYVNQIIPQNFDFTKPATIICTFQASSLLQLNNSPKARFKLGILVQTPRGLITKEKDLELTLSQTSASINTWSLQFTVPPSLRRRLAQGINPLVRFTLTRYNGQPDNFTGDLEFMGYQVEYTPTPKPAV